MGMDFVELLMATEDEFGIAFSDEEAVSCVAPGRLTDVVWEKVRNDPNPVCPSLAAFHAVRRALVETLGVERRAVKLDAPLRQFADPDRARGWWPALGEACGATTWPELRRPRWLVYGWGAMVLGAVGCAIVLSLVLAARGFHVSTVAVVFCCAFGAVVATALAAEVTDWTQTIVPPEVARVRDLVPFVSRTPWVCWTSGEKVTREMVAERIRKVVLLQTNIPEAAYSEDARFREDLGVD